MANMNYLRILTRSFQVQLRCPQRLFATTAACNVEDKKMVIPQRPFNTSIHQRQEVIEKVICFFELI